MLNFVLIRVLQKQGPTDGARRQPIPGQLPEPIPRRGSRASANFPGPEKGGSGAEFRATRARIRNGRGARVALVALVALVGDEGGAALETALGSRTKLHQNE